MAQAITRQEQYLAAMASGGSIDIKPVTREEMYLAKAAGQDVNVPEPVTRKEMFLQRVALNGGGTGGGGGTSATLIKKPITANGTYSARNDGADGYSEVVVNVPNVIPDGYIKPTGTKPITENGIHDVTEYASVSVNVASSGGSGDGDSLLTQVLDKSVTSISNESVTSLGLSIFNSCKGLTSVDFPKALSPGQYAFQKCTSLTSINFPKAVRTDYASFNGCTKLASVDFPCVQEIANQTFNGCTALTTLVLRSSTLCSLKNIGAFNNVPNGLTVYVPSALIESYQNATNWSSMYANGKCTFVAIEGSEYE
jgi:hypothetical protein